MVNYIELQVKQLNEAQGDRHLKDGYFCSKCNNKGFLYALKNEEIVSYRCSCQSVRKSLYLIKQSGLSYTVDKCTFDSFLVKENWQRAIKESALRFSQGNGNEGSIFFIGGQSGSGKTHLCTAITRELMMSGKPTLYLMWTSDSRRLKSIVNEPEYAKEVQAYKDIKVLYIDDFLKTTLDAQPTSSDITLAFDIINHRLLDPTKLTVISSELSINKIMELDEATGSRIRQGARGFLHCINKDISKNQRLK